MVRDLNFFQDFKSNKNSFSYCGCFNSRIWETLNLSACADSSTDATSPKPCRRLWSLLMSRICFLCSAASAVPWGVDLVSPPHVLACRTGLVRTESKFSSGTILTCGKHCHVEVGGASTRQSALLCLVGSSLCVASWAPHRSCPCGCLDWSHG